jgi:hypothetical protein
MGFKSFVQDDNDDIIQTILKVVNFWMWNNNIDIICKEYKFSFGFDG